mgnify:CR=1 FL=1
MLHWGDCQIFVTTIAWVTNSWTSCENGAVLMPYGRAYLRKYELTTRRMANGTVRRPFSTVAFTFLFTNYLLMQSSWHDFFCKADCKMKLDTWQKGTHSDFPYGRMKYPNTIHRRKSLFCGMLNHPKIFECFSDCFLFFRRTLRLPGILWFRQIIVFAYLNSTFPFNLWDIEVGHL